MAALATDTLTIRRRDDRGRARAREGRLSPIRFALRAAALSLLTLVWSLYLLAFGFSKGSDSTGPEYGKYWYTMLAINVLVLFPAITLIILRLASSRCKVCVAHEAADGVMAPAHEMQHHWMFLGILLTGALSAIGGFAIAIGGDAAWHQSALHDTSITPIHTFSFYGFAPLTFLALVTSYVTPASLVVTQCSL